MVQKTVYSIRTVISCFITCALLCTAAAFAASPDPKHLERSFQLQVSLSNLPDVGQWSTNFPAAALPLESEIRHAARLLTEDYAANRLYLVYQKEISISDAERLFSLWRQCCPVEVELVPALVLQSGPRHTPVFSPVELKLLGAFFKKEVNGRVLALRGAQQSDPGVNALAEQFKLLKMDLASNEKPGPLFAAGIEDVSGFLNASYKDTEWESTGHPKLIAWLQTQADAKLPRTLSLAPMLPHQGQSADPERDDAMPPGRNTVAAHEILSRGGSGSLTGLSIDLNALQGRSGAVSHDGSGYAFYEMLKRGHIYVGYYARPFHEIVKVYETLRSGQLP
jgi:hypothetical protein